MLRPLALGGRTPCRPRLRHKHPRRRRLAAARPRLSGPNMYTWPRSVACGPAGHAPLLPKHRSPPSDGACSRRRCRGHSTTTTPEQRQHLREGQQPLSSRRCRRSSARFEARRRLRGSTRKSGTISFGESDALAAGAMTRALLKREPMPPTRSVCQGASYAVMWANPNVTCSAEKSADTAALDSLASLREP